jgi:hypothetical protein
MTEKKFKYTAKIKQPQTVVEVKLDPKGGFLSEREIKTVKKDAYGASLLEKGLLVIAEQPATAEELSVAAAPATPSAPASNGAGDTVPDFDERGFEPK